MILRKPYAFFIKNFKLINLILAILTIFLSYKTYLLARFFSNYSLDYAKAISNFTIDKFLTPIVFITNIIIIIGIIIVLVVLFIKEKPKKLYLYSLILFIATMVLYYINYNILFEITKKTLDIRVSQALRDINYIALILQIISFFPTLVRATGFNLKQFEFSKDLQDLNIEEKDNEEVEVALEVDANQVRTNITKNIRNIKYSYLEHKFIYNIIISVSLILIIGLTYYNKTKYSDIYEEGREFTASTYTMSVNSSYITNTDQLGNKITENNNSLVIVKLKIHKNTSSKTTFNTGIINLRIGNNSYGKSRKYGKYLTDLGTEYIDQNLTEEFQNYILIYEIPSNQVDKKMKLKINDNTSYIGGIIGANNIYINLKPKNLNKVKQQKNYKLNEEITFSSTSLDQTTLTINKVEINNNFKEEYQYCLKTGKCYKAYENITPTATGNYLKTLLKITNDYQIDETLNITALPNIYYFLNQFGTIYYKIDDEWYFEKINSKLIKPIQAKHNNITYIEVNREIQQAKEIYFKFKIRNNTYKYTIK